MNRVVMDTNVLVSALLSNGPPAAIIDMAAEGKLTLFNNDLIISEYWNVLQRPKFGFHSTQISRLIHNIVRAGITIEVNSQSIIPMPHEDDRIFYDVANVSHAFLITGNIKHYPHESYIVAPADFLKMYQLNRQEPNVKRAKR